MVSHRAHIVIPQDLVEQIDALVGPRGRSAFLVETARAELRKRALFAFLDSGEPAGRMKIIRSCVHGNASLGEEPKSSWRGTSAAHAREDEAG